MRWLSGVRVVWVRGVVGSVGVRVVGNYTNWEVAKSDTHPQVVLS